MSDYYTKLKILWDELMNLRPIPNCNCDPVCFCGALQTVQNYQHNDHVIWFLKGLNDRFATVRS